MSMINGFIAGWMSHRRVLIELLDSVGNEQLNFRPWEGGMSFAELTTHVIGSTSMFVRIVGGGTPEKAAPAAYETIEQLRDFAKSQTEQTKAELESITEEQLQRIVEFATMKMTGQAMLEMAKEHEIHHKGQLLTYARIAGVEKLPFFVSR